MVLLRAGNGGEHAFDRQGFGVDVGFLHQLGDEALGVVGIVDREGVVVAV